jgi:hypothetical protein
VNYLTIQLKMKDFSSTLKFEDRKSTKYKARGIRVIQKNAQGIVL